jgi:hypothetical protein
LLSNAHIVESRFERGGLRDLSKPFGVFGAHQFRLFLESFEFLQTWEIFGIRFGLQNLCRTFIV